MITVIRKVFYCEHCKRHRLTKSSIEHHEPRCIYNPERSHCGWHDDRRSIGNIPALALNLRETLDLDPVRRITDCPACLLAVVVQADLTSPQREDLGFVYEQEVAAFRARERQQGLDW